MNQDNNTTDVTKNIKSENKKALVPFFIILFLSMLGGGIIGFLTNFVSRKAILEFKSVVHQALITASPYLLAITTVILISIALILFLHYKGMYRKNPDDEELMDVLEWKLNYPMIFLTIHMVTSFTFFGIFLLQDGKYPRTAVLLSLIAFTLGIACNIIVNQWIVDFVKSMNPEKKGSVYDFKFAKKWENSCDEGQLLIVYKAAYRSMRITNTVCIFLWVALVLAGMLFSIGIFPMIILMIVWFTQLISFTIESTRLERTR